MSVAWPQFRWLPFPVPDRAAGGTVSLSWTFPIPQWLVEAATCKGGSISGRAPGRYASACISRRWLELLADICSSTQGYIGHFIYPVHMSGLPNDENMGVLVEWPVDQKSLGE